MNKKNLALEKHLKKALPVARAAALDAGRFIKRKFGKFKNLQRKPDTSLVTEVDKGAEKIVVRHLKKAFPHDHILAEETGATHGRDQNEFRWHIDPLDGTTNFVHGFPMFCVSIGLEFERSDLVLGVIYHPITGDLYTAAKNLGAHRNKKPIHVSSTATLGHSLLSTGFSMRRDGGFDREMATFARMSRDSHAIRRTGSAALDLTFVATGQFDGFWERNLSPWDVAAALALLSETGGAYSQFDGKPYRIGDATLVASNGRLHREFLDCLNGRNQ